MVIDPVQKSGDNQDKPKQTTNQQQQRTNQPSQPSNPGDKKQPAWLKLGTKK